MKYFLNAEVQQSLSNIRKTDKKIFHKIEKKLEYFIQNHTHSSLRNHKLKGNLSNTWSISIEGNIRMLYYISEGMAVFFLIGTHDEVYKK